MSAEALNANPTVLNVSDLPTRRRQQEQRYQGTSSTKNFASFVTSVRCTPDVLAADGSSDSSLLDETDDESDALPEQIDEQEVFDLISTISDPEHPLSLGSLAVVSLPDIHISPPRGLASPIRTVTVLVTPTITHCSLATVIGLGVRVRLEQALPPRFRVDVRIKEGSHTTAEQVTKQLNDKERVAAALENGTLMSVLKKMLVTCR